MAMVQMGLDILSVLPIPPVSNIAGVAVGMLEVASGQLLTGLFSIATSCTIPWSRWFGGAAGKVIGMTRKGSIANKAGKIAAKVAGNAYKLVGGVQVANALKKVGKEAAKSFRFAELFAVRAATKSLKSCVSYMFRTIVWNGVGYLKG